MQSKIVRMTCRTKSGLLDLVTRVVRDHSSDLILLRVFPKDSDWLRRRCCLGDLLKDAPKDSDLSRRRCRLGDCPKDSPKDSDWLRQRFRLGDLPKDSPKDSDWSS